MLSKSKYLATFQLAESGQGRSQCWWEGCSVWVYDAPLLWAQHVYPAALAAPRRHPATRCVVVIITVNP